MNHYKRLPLLAHSSVSPGDPLKWWKLNETMLPLLSKVARRILNIPATSASSERTFSTAGLVISQKRQRLSPETASAIVHLNGAWSQVDKFYANKKINSASNDNSIEVIDVADV